jgi:AP-4 complex subunit epsilon-1
LTSINPDLRLSYHEQSPRADLISLDTPFIAEPKPGEEGAPEEQSEQSDDFATVWDTATAFSARGWYDGTLDAVVRRLQGLGFPRGLSVLSADQPPFQGRLGLCSYTALGGIDLNCRRHTTGELKILILGGLDGHGRAAVRLHENADNDEDGCLWRMRSEDDGVLGAVKQVLAG